MPKLSERVQGGGRVATLEAALDLQLGADLPLGLGERPQAVVGRRDRASEFGLDLRLVAEPFPHLVGGAVEHVQELDLILGGIVGGLGLGQDVLRQEFVDRLRLGGLVPA